MFVLIIVSHLNSHENFVLYPITTTRFPDSTINRMIGLLGCVVFGGGGLALFYKDCKWHFRHKKEKE